MRKIERDTKGAGIFKPGLDLVTAGTIGKAGLGAALLGKINEISEKYPSWFITECRRAAKEPLPLTDQLLTDCGAMEWEEVSEGGILTALWNLSGAYEQGISFELGKIPIDQETVEICEMFDVNPYRLASGNCILMAVKNGLDAVNVLEEAKISAAVIGKVEKGIARRMIGMGTTGFLERPTPDEVYKFKV